MSHRWMRPNWAHFFVCLFFLKLRKACPQEFKTLLSSFLQAAFPPCSFLPMSPAISPVLFIWILLFWHLLLYIFVNVEWLLSHELRIWENMLCICLWLAIMFPCVVFLLEFWQSVGNLIGTVITACLNQVSQIMSKAIFFSWGAQHVWKYTRENADLNILAVHSTDPISWYPLILFESAANGRLIDTGSLGSLSFLIM